VIGRVDRTYSEPALAVASARSVPASSPRSRADVLYRAKRFGEAAALLRAAATSFDARTAHDMRSVAVVYSMFGDAYTLGMGGPQVGPVERFEALEKARVLDRTLGGAYLVEIEAALAIAVPRAAIAYAARKDFESARRAVRIADSLGVDTDSMRAVRAWLASNERRF